MLTTVDHRVYFLELGVLMGGPKAIAERPLRYHEQLGKMQSCWSLSCYNAINKSLISSAPRLNINQTTEKSGMVICKIEDQPFHH